MNSITETSPLLYRKYMFMFGVLTLLLLLKYLEEKENYEECEKIIGAIKEQEERLETSFPREISNKTINEIKEIYKTFGLTGENLMENSLYYRDYIINELKENKLLK